MNSSKELENAVQARQKVEAMYRAALARSQATLSSRAAEMAAAAKLNTAPPGLKFRAARYQALAAALAATQMAIRKVPKQAADSFIIHGQVLNAAGEPMAKVNVSLSDAKGIVNTRVPPVTTDASGYYTMTLRANEFPDLTPDTSEMFVSVTDANNRQLAKPAQTIKYQPGKVTIMPIVAA
jgi:hypothetical protein